MYMLRGEVGGKRKEIVMQRELPSDAKREAWCWEDEQEGVCLYTTITFSSLSLTANSKKQAVEWKRISKRCEA